ncbi:MAG: SDR family oxidoreductase [Candidatus Lokiarchaeota archaeon]|nr:SDR family oxidoreductase [Candidatus Lokiarchaeota archaeon]
MGKVSDLFSLKDKVVIITGGAAGIGIWMVEALADMGAKIVAVGRGKHGSLEELINKIKQEYNVDIIGVKCDVGIEDEVKNLVKTAIETFDHVDILINNAGITWGSPSEKMNLSDWDKVIKTNLTGAFLVSREVGAHMIERKSGVILNISSVWSLFGAEWGAVGYACSKAGLNGLTRQLAIEWAKHNIRVNALALSFFPSGMSNFFIDNFGKVLKKGTPLKRIGEKEDIQGMVIAMVSDCSRYVTGQVVVIDGGMTTKMGVL